MHPKSVASVAARLALATALLAPAACLTSFPKVEADAGATPDSLTYQTDRGAPVDARIGRETGPPAPLPDVDTGLVAEDASSVGVDGRIQKPDGAPADMTLAPPPPPPPPPPDPDAGPPPPLCTPVPETCNGLDDDCDGQVDNGLRCGDFVANHCRAWLGWADVEMPADADTWGLCPAIDPGIDVNRLAPVGCTSTAGDSAFHVVPFAGDVDGTDSLAVAFNCDPAFGTLATFVQTHCHVFLGQHDLAVFEDHSLEDSWGGCPAAERDTVFPSACVGSAGDGRFHSVRLAGDVNFDDWMGIAFICRAAPEEGPDAAARVAALASGTAVFLGYDSDAELPPGGTTATFGNCPEADQELVFAPRCTSSMGDGRFHGIPMVGLGDVDVGDVIAIALRSLGP